MKPTRLILLSVPLALVAACGGSTSESTFQAAAPSYSALSMDLASGDSTAPSALTAAGGSDAVTAIGDPTCHPYLFLRSHHLVERVNRHLWFFLRHVENVIRRNPDTVTGSTQIWERVFDGIDVRFTMTRSSDTVFTWGLEMKKVGDADFTPVFTGTIDRANAQGPHQGVGDIDLNLTNLSAVTGLDVAGDLKAHFETFTASRLVVVDASNVTWDADSDSALVRSEKSAHYVYYREPGKGGSLKLDEQMVFACPSNPSSLPADVKLVSRWYRNSSGTVNGRSDALMVGGQLLAGNSVVGLTCHHGASDGADQIDNAWLMKEEDASGATIVGGQIGSGGDPASACDPIFGAVPALANDATDFDMSGIVFTDSTPYPFPNM